MEQMNSKAELEAILAPVGQTHVLRFWDELNDAEKKQLAGQIRSVNWKETCQWVENALKGESVKVPFDELKPAPYTALDGDPAFLEKCRKRGEELLAAGKVAGFTVAGGQGTRLGYDGPKGTFCFTELENKSLFQIFAEGLARHQEKCGHVLPWYIMTSPVNDAPTRKFFADHNYFGLDSSNIMFFTQGMLPAFDLEGKAVLGTKCSLALSANGHGGSFAALRDSGALADMARRGVEILSYWQVDNALVNQFDPAFIGMHDLTGSEMSSRALIKRDPLEKLGHFCLLGDKMIIIEYSDMPEQQLYQKDADGKLSYRAGSPAIHVLSCDFIQRLTNGVLDFKPHRANKKVPFVDEQGNAHKPESPNAIKLEFFLFDALPLAKNPLVFEGDRANQFAPIKNAQGQDSPDSCRKAMLDRTIAWYELTGRKFPRKADGSPDGVIEISPRLAVDAEDGRAFFAGQEDLKAGCRKYFG